MRITVESLERLHACASQIALFSRLYPDGVELPKRNPARQAVLDAAARGGLDVSWWLRAARETGVLRLWRNGVLVAEEHYLNGRLNDAGDTPALREWDNDGVLIAQRHGAARRLGRRRHPSVEGFEGEPIK